MNDRSVQIMEEDGRPEYAVVPIDEYRRMAASLEEAADRAAIERAVREDAAGETFPARWCTPSWTVSRPCARGGGTAG